MMEIWAVYMCKIFLLHMVPVGIIHTLDFQWMVRGCQDVLTKVSRVSSGGGKMAEPVFCLHTLSCLRLSHQHGS